MGEVLKFPEPDVIELRKAPGATFRKPDLLLCVRQYFDHDLGKHFNEHLPAGDRFLAYLSLLGFKVVPRDDA